MKLIATTQLTIMATQELVVPKSIPITSPASLLFHLDAPNEEAWTPSDGVLDRVIVERERRRPSWSAIVCIDFCV